MKRIKILMEKRLTPDIRDAEIDKIKKEISAEERKIWGQIKKRKNGTHGGNKMGSRFKGGSP